MTRSLLGITIAFAAFSFVSGAPFERYPAPVTGGGAGGFVGLDGGAFRLQSLSTGGALSAELKFSTGWGLTVPLGYDFGNGFKLFFSAGYYSASISDLIGHYDGQSQSVVRNGAFSFVPLMANASYDIRLADHVRWQLGVGAGMARAKSSFSAYDFPGTTSIIFGQFPGRQIGTFGGLSDSQWVFSFTAFTGLVFDITSQTAFHLGYRYLHVNDSFSMNGESSGSINGHVAEAGLTFKF